MALHEQAVHSTGSIFVHYVNSQAHGEALEQSKAEPAMVSSWKTKACRYHDMNSKGIIVPSISFEITSRVTCSVY